jgi:shikimate dehydrogenase
MYPNVSEGPVVPGEWLGPEQVVVDLTYNPRETTLLQAARAQGADTVDGTGMLVHQGAISLGHWSGQEAPVETMREALLAALAG